VLRINEETGAAAISTSGWVNHSRYFRIAASVDALADVPTQDPIGFADTNHWINGLILINNRFYDSTSIEVLRSELELLQAHPEEEINAPVAAGSLIWAIASGEVISVDTVQEGSVMRHVITVKNVEN